LEFVVREDRVFADPVDVERALQPTARDQGHGDERLGLDRRIRNEANAGVEVRLVGEHGLPVLDRPAGDSLAEDDRPVGEHLLRPRPPHEHRLQRARGLVRLVDVEVVVRDQLADGVGDPLQQCIQALLGEDVVEDVGEAPVGLDDAGLGGRRRLGHEPQGRGRRVRGGRVHRTGSTVRLSVFCAPRLRSPGSRESAPARSDLRD
jgi:hypothetical protein